MRSRLRVEFLGYSLGSVVEISGLKTYFRADMMGYWRAGSMTEM